MRVCAVVEKNAEVKYLFSLWFVLYLKFFTYCCLVLI